jgi:hypothetical protein
MKNSRGLKKCPFCGETEDISLRLRIYEGLAEGLAGKKYWFVECLPCDAQTGLNFDDDALYQGFKNGKEMAIFNWNLRNGVVSDPNTPHHLIQALNKIVYELKDMSSDEFAKVLKEHENGDLALSLMNAWNIEE